MILLRKRGSRKPSVRNKAFRRKSDEPFGATDLALVERLVPHLQRVLAIDRALQTAEMVRDAALETLDRMPEGWILLGPDARVLATNRSAQQILERGDTLRLEGGRLAAAGEAPAERLRALVERATDADSEAAGGAPVTATTGFPPDSAQWMFLNESWRDGWRRSKLRWSRVSRSPRQFGSSSTWASAPRLTGRM